jgi:diguanylate cyclase (GGDEF)-like protein
MHELAAKLLRYASEGKAIPQAAFDRFSEALDSLKLEIQALKTQLEDLLHNRDPLTGAENRVAMLGKLREVQEMVLRGGPGSCVAIFDLDHFKAINDRFGHLIGDQVLAAVVSGARQALRKYDRIYRFGGEEFVILMPNTASDAALACCERVRARIAALPAAQSRGQRVTITVSFGVAPLDRTATVETALARADAALYQAKKSGRNRSVLWS